MERESWLELERHLHFLLPMDPAERQAYLRQVCGEDSSMRLRVESWLSAENEMGSFLEAKPGVPKLTTPPEPGDDLPQLMEGQRFGAYRVKREIGRGGMSVVALAVHEDLGRHVAIKVIKQSMTSAETLQRFLSERQILANLNHPSIAQFHEGGTSEDGQPYFVMEYIEGEPIDRYCDRLRLSIDERLTLFRRVCRAAHYAHQNLVVHRDIKPSNILVTKNGEPKLLDFGIAKLLDPAPGHHRRQQTTAWMRMMTPNYASPEQVSGCAITTASDVYSLGVLLHELMTGVLPDPFESSRPGGIKVSARDLRFGEEARAKPSDVVAGLEDSDGGSREICRARATSPSKLSRRLRGNLDTIILTALKLEPSRRYSSVERLAEDLRRSQAGLTILARGDSLGYRLQMFLGRHRIAVPIALGAAILIISLAVTAAGQAIKVHRAQVQTEQVSEFLISLFDESAAGSGRSDLITAREILDAGAARVNHELDEQPEVRARLMDTIGRAYSNLRFFDRAIGLFDGALRLRRQTLGEGHPLVATSLRHLAVAQKGAGLYDESEKSFQQALEVLRGLPDDASPDIAEALHGLGELKVAQGDFEGAGGYARQAVEMRSGLLGPNHVSTAESQALWARCLRDVGDYEKSVRLFEAAIPKLRKEPGHRPQLAKVLNDFGFLKLELGELDDAEGPIREGLALRRELFGEEHPAYAESLATLSFLLIERNDPERAIPLIRHTLEIHEERFGALHPSVARDRFNLAIALFESGGYRESEEIFRQLLTTAVRLVGDEHPRVATIRSGLGFVLHAQGQLEEAEELFRHACSDLSQSVGEDHVFLAMARLGLGSLLVDRGEYSDAEPLLRASLKVFKATYGEGHLRVAQVHSELAACLIDRGELRAAKSLLNASYPVLEARRGEDSRSIRRARRLIRDLERATSTKSSVRRGDGVQERLEALRAKSVEPGAG